MQSIKGLLQLPTIVEAFSGSWTAEQFVSVKNPQFLPKPFGHRYHPLLSFLQIRSRVIAALRTSSPISFPVYQRSIHSRNCRPQCCRPLPIQQNKRRLKIAADYKIRNFLPFFWLFSPSDHNKDR